jgi:hypothetical protein
MKLEYKESTKDHYYFTTLQRRMNANDDGYLFMLIWHNELNKFCIRYTLLYMCIVRNNVDI